MKETDRKFDSEIVRAISETNIYIHKKNCRQLRLLNINELKKFSHQIKVSNFSEEFIGKLWQLGFIQADCILSSVPLPNEDFIEFGKEDDTFLYADERGIQGVGEDFYKTLTELERLSDDIRLLFHPFRCYTLYHLNKMITLSVLVISFSCPENREKLISNIDSLTQRMLTPQTKELFKYWNNLVSLCVISESSVHRLIYHKVRWHNNFEDDYESMLKKLQELQPMISSLFEQIGEDAIETYRRELCQQAEEIDPNKNLHLIIRLINATQREQLKGSIAATMLFLSMAETLRRNLERTFNKEYPEEDECGFGTVFPEAKIELQGSRRVLDENRIVVNQFLRRFGLDYGIRVNIYVEGDTEFAALKTEFAENSSILVINLKGAFVEKNGKGVAFRESLRNDLKSKAFSLIVFDREQYPDPSNNFRAVKQAAKNDEICGRFFVAKPDFEMENFTIPELAQITLQIVEENGITGLHPSDIEEVAKDAETGKEFFKSLRTLSPDLTRIDKGEKWGQYLMSYAKSHPRSKEFGNEKDRLINQITALAYHCCASSYEVTRKNYKIDPDTGKLLKR
ncbi:hypothetical protein GF339_10725 [candidate division KSB3 bacterium]|uniref:Uncharacterized protein n=1 Tax=candidate division KSB3 bacterium TaxID=2044937 RepID=A0A9D5Q5W0_9BACT|nr:hypothetical protein [candidate division KSB3 bacterium]MBD3325050.1 hypothetical protein [candidate division KSB3 bacterium]